MAALMMAAIFFDGIHFLFAGSALRVRLVRVMGEEAFQTIFSVMSLGGIIWLSRTYRYSYGI